MRSQPTHDTRAGKKQVYRASCGACPPSPSPGVPRAPPSPALAHTPRRLWCSPVSRRAPPEPHASPSARPPRPATNTRDLLPDYNHYL
ncbi:unnamed protein product, partial [Brenthis ino]